MAPSPMTAMTLLDLPARSRATAMPSPAEIEVEECAAPNGSYSLSARLVKPERPPPWRKRADAVAPAGQDLVRIGLVADVPDQPVLRGVEHVMERDRQLDDPEPGAEMAARDRDGVDGLLAQLVRQLAQLAAVQPTQVGRRLDEIEQWGLGRLRHGRLHRQEGGNLTGCPWLNQPGQQGQIRNVRSP